MFLFAWDVGSSPVRVSNHVADRVNARLTSFTRLHRLQGVRAGVLRGRGIVRSFVVSLLVSLALLTATPGLAQTRPQVRVVAPTLTTPGTVAIIGVLSDKAFDRLMRSAFPVRIHVKAELWRTRTFWDQLSASTEWDLIIQFDTFRSEYEVLRVVGDSIRSLGIYSKLSDAQYAAELPYAHNLPNPPRGRESYINVQADVQTIDMTDLDELMGWLRGEARPAVRGEKNPGSVIGRAFRSIGTQVLGGEVRFLEGRTKPFKL